MKKLTAIAAIAFLVTSLSTAQAQPGPRGGPGGPRLGGAMIKLFGDNKDFSATIVIESKKGGAEGDSKVSGKMSIGDGKSRFEMSLENVKGGRMTPEALAQMKSMGLAEFVFISRPDKKIVYQICPGLKSYADTPFNAKDDPALAENAKMDVSPLGSDTVDGHPCTKNKVTITTQDGQAVESTVWNASDLKNFPVKIERSEDGTTASIYFKDVKLSAPDKALFDPPTDFQHYDSPQQMMQEAMMKRFGGAPGGIPVPPAPK